MSEQDYSDMMHRENDQHYFKSDELSEHSLSDYDPLDYYDDDYEMQIECDACDGDGWQGCEDGIKIPCAECGGTGWF